MSAIVKVTELDKAGSDYSVYEIDTPVKYLSFLVGRLSLTEERAGGLPLSRALAYFPPSSPLMIVAILAAVVKSGLCSENLKFFFPAKLLSTSFSTVAPFTTPRDENSSTNCSIGGSGWRPPC